MVTDGTCSLGCRLPASKEPDEVSLESSLLTRCGKVEFQRVSRVEHLEIDTRAIR